MIKKNLVAHFPCYSCYACYAIIMHIMKLRESISTTKTSVL